MKKARGVATRGPDCAVRTVRTTVYFFLSSFFFSSLPPLASAGAPAAAGGAFCAVAGTSAAGTAAALDYLFDLLALDRDRHHHGVFLALEHRGHALGQNQVAHAQRVVGLEARQVDGDELGQVLRQARDVDFGHHVADQRGGFLHGRRVLLAGEVQRHAHVDLLGLGHALEVDVQHERPVRVHLEVTQQDALALAVELHVEDRGVELFLAQRMEQRVVVDSDRHRLALAAIDHAGNLVGVAQAAARTRALRFSG